MEDTGKIFNPWYLEAAKGKSGEAATTSTDQNVRVESNKIYFYSEVSRPNNLTLNRSIASLSDKLYNQSESLGTEPANIHLHINSFGGSVFAGFSTIDYILNSKVPVTTIIDGCAASAATMMSVVGAHRVMHRHSFMLIHQLSSGMWGKYENLKDDIKNCDLLMETIKGIYEERTKIPKKELKEILKRDLWWDADTCLKYGLIDEIR